VSLAFYVAHQTEGRTRLRVLDAIEDVGLFADIAERIAAFAGVEAAQPRAATGSLVVLHPLLAGAELLELLVDAGVVLQEQPRVAARPALVPLRERFDQANALVREASQGSADLHTLAFLGLGGLALMQALRGQTLTNASSLLWYAYQIANRASRDKP